MENLILGTIVFVLAFLIRFILYLVNKKRRNKKNEVAVWTDMQYLVNRFKIDIKKLDKVHIAAIISFIDALIITAAIILAVVITDNIILELLIGLVVVLVLIIGINKVFGRILLKRGYGKDV